MKCNDCITYSICRSTILEYIEKYRKAYEDKADDDDIVSFHFMLHNAYYTRIFKKCNKIDKEITKLKPYANLTGAVKIILNSLNISKEEYEPF